MQLLLPMVKPVVTGTRIPPVVEGQDGGGDEMNEEYLRTDKWSSMLPSRF